MAAAGERTREDIEYGWIGASIIPPIGVIVGIMKIIEKRPVTGTVMIAVGVISFFLWQFIFSL
ncbi:MAG: hypothetical protein JWR90_2336 [Marmoricola sp.]|jgi:hypothetical protein|nr:hypothetical protein [Marmoricola sp.]